jgi:hypothetical protein
MSYRSTQISCRCVPDMWITLKKRYLPVFGYGSINMKKYDSGYQTFRPHFPTHIILIFLIFSIPTSSLGLFFDISLLPSLLLSLFYLLITIMPLFCIKRYCVIRYLSVSVIPFVGETSVWNPRTVYFSWVKEGTNASPSPPFDLGWRSVTIFKRAPRCQEENRAWDMFFWNLLNAANRRCYINILYKLLKILKNDNCHKINKMSTE